MPSLVKTRSCVDADLSSFLSVRSRMPSLVKTRSCIDSLNLVRSCSDCFQIFMKGNFENFFYCIS
jgi:hypothetical protein